jgi:amino acid adenylation domain-containing protein
MAVDHRDLSDAKRALLAQRLRGEGTGVERSVARRHSSGPAPLSITQEQLWYFSQLAPESPVYNELVTIRKTGPFDLDAFRRAFNEIVRRHEIWRTTFETTGGKPLQVVHPITDIELRRLDLSTRPRAEAEREAARLAAEQAPRPYQLDRLPLLRPLLVRFGEDDHRMYLALHHLIFDGVSLSRIVLPELTALYEAFASGRKPALTEPPLQYADYAAWSQQWTQTEEYARRMRYWRQHLQSAPLLQLPLDRPRPPRLSFRGAVERLQLSRELAGRLHALGSQENATLFQVLASSFAVLLQRYSGGQKDIVFAVATDFRPRPELESVVGYCVTPLVLRIDVSGEPPFLDLLRRVRAELLGGLDHQVPFARLVRELQPHRDASINPFFQAILTLEPPFATADRSWSHHQMDPELGNVMGCAKFDLELRFDESPDGQVDGRLIFNTDVFDVATARRMIGHWHTLLEGIVADPSCRVSELPLLTEDESRQLAGWNATNADYPRQSCVHELIAAQASRAPDAVAAVFGDELLTYGELEQRANRIAHRILATRASGSLVAICAERSLDMLVGMLGILKAGAAYLPLDPHHPPDRLAFVLEDSGAPVLLTQRQLLPSLPHHRAEVICLDDSFVDQPDTAPAAPVSPDNLAYVLYTSGSTGRPKGVCVHHRALVNFLTSMARLPGMSKTDTIVAITTYAFDIAAVELWLPLITGARTVIAPQEVASDGRRLMQATPATWQMLIDAGWSGRPGLVALCGGEALPPRLANALIDRTAVLWNMFGPTETTVWSTIAAVQRGDGITIGRPIANTTVHIVDRRLHPVPVGVTGELLIGGDGVARGYLNRSELTAERFVADPFSTDPGARLYRTGDLARHCVDGNIEYLGRLDHQVKIRGHRVECGEVEAVLADHPAVAEAVVVAREDEDGRGQRLVAYIVPAGGGAPGLGEPRAHLRSRLPDYMVPAAFVTLDALPLTPNGKVDRKALPPPEWKPVSTTPVAPRTAVEERLAGIWARILHVDPVGVNDDFFELGGHSLLAVRLLVEVEREFGVEVPLTAFFEGSGTVAGLAAAIEATRGAEVVADRLTIPVQPLGTAPILFFIHADESGMLTLRHFIGPLGSDQRVVGLLPERIGRRFDRSRSIEDLASPMLETIRQSQPHGPYFLAGYSLGGLLAYEIAGRLQAAGEHVGWLGVLDAGTPAAGARYRQQRLSLRHRVARQRERGARGAAHKTYQVLRREFRAALVRLGLRRSEMSDEFDWRGAKALAARYACPPNEVAMDLFVTAERAAGSGNDSLGWAELHEGVLRIHRFEGDHLGMVTEPQVNLVAEIFSRSLREAVRASKAS